MFLANFLLIPSLYPSSFYLSINGAKTFSDISHKELSSNNIATKAITDSLNKVYDNKLKKIEQDKVFYFEMVSSGTKNNKLRSQYNKMIDTANVSIKNLEIERSNKIKESENKELIKLQGKQSEISSNVSSFIIISTFIEFIILIGVWFNTFYKVRAYREYDDKLVTDTNLSKYHIYDTFLNILYNNGKIKKGDNFYSASKFKDLLKIKGVNTTEKSMKDFFTLLKHIKVYMLLGNQRRIEKSFDESKELLKEYFETE